MTLGILSFLIGGFTMAYFSDEIKNYELATFTTAKVEIEVKRDEHISQQSTNYAESRNIEWEIKNKGTESIRLKTTVIKSGSDSHEEVLLDSGDNWILGDDGDYYYTEEVQPKTTVIFPLALQFDTWNTVGDYGINIEAEAIQASNDAIDYKWLEHSYGK